MAKTLLDRVLDFARDCEDVRAVTMEGSRTDSHALKDRYSDYDVCFYVRDIRRFTQDKSWVKTFGDPVIMQCAEDCLRDYDYESREPYIFMMQFADESRVDLGLKDLGQIDREYDFGEPRQVLLNKDNFPQLRESGDNSCYFVKKPTEKEYADGMGRRALQSYIKYGFIPMEDGVKEAFHNDEQTSRTMEYAFDDYAVAQMAKALQHEADHNMLMKRAGNWRNVINPRTGYADGRHQNGRFENNTDFIHRKSFFTEGAACHYTWYVPHDPESLIQLLGGKNRFAERLDSMFAGGSYWHGNEPCHQMAYMFGYADRPDLTRKWVSHIMRTEYDDSPGGLSGNDDAGQMSAWYVFSAMGFYPVCPASTQYMLGTPLFKQVKVNLENGHSFTILGKDSLKDGLQAILNGQGLTKYAITHDDLMNGGTLQLIKTQK